MISCEIVTSDQLDAVNIDANSCVVEHRRSPLDREQVSCVLDRRFFLPSRLVFLSGWEFLVALYFGNDIEGVMDRLGVLALYSIAGIGGSLAHVMFNRDRSSLDWGD